MDKQLEYGYMDNGRLRSRFLTDMQTTKVVAGRRINYLVSAEQQARQLPEGWKPVDKIDTKRLLQAKGRYIILPQPYDAGDHIAYNYVKKYDTQAIRLEIKEHEAALAESDYKVVRCMEAHLAQTEMPYDFQALHKEREDHRRKIARLRGLFEKHTASNK